MLTGFDSYHGDIVGATAWPSTVWKPTCRQVLRAPPLLTQHLPEAASLTDTSHIQLRKPPDMPGTAHTATYLRLIGFLLSFRRKPLCIGDVLLQPVAFAALSPHRILSLGFLHGPQVQWPVLTILAMALHRCYHLSHQWPFARAWAFLWAPRADGSLSPLA